MYNFVKQQDGALAVGCRMFEIWFYDYFLYHLLCFCFNKTKQSGLQPPAKLNGRTLIEAIV